MPSIDIHKFRNVRQIRAWLKVGLTIDVIDRNRVVARIVPDKGSSTQVKWPDFEARRRKILGGRVFQAEDFLETRHGRY